MNNQRSSLRAQNVSRFSILKLIFIYSSSMIFFKDLKKSHNISSTFAYVFMLLKLSRLLLRLLYNYFMYKIQTSVWEIPSNHKVNFQVSSNFIISTVLHIND